MRTLGILGLLCFAFGLSAPSASAQCPNGQCGMPQYRIVYPAPPPPVVTPQATLSADEKYLTYPDGTVYEKSQDGIYRERVCGPRPLLVGGKKPGCSCYPCECNK